MLATEWGRGEKSHLEFGGPGGATQSDAGAWREGRTGRFGRTRHLQTSLWMFVFFETLVSP